MKKLAMLFLAIFTLVLVMSAGIALAVDKVGFVDDVYVLSQSDKFQKAQQNLEKLSKTKAAAAKTAFDKEKDEKKKQQIVQNMQLELRESESKMITPIISEINAIISRIAKAKGITIVLNRQLVLYGGVDITEDVAKEVKKQK